MDPLERMQLQTDISKFQQKVKKDTDVFEVLQAAADAMKARDWLKAKQKYQEARAGFSPDVKVLDILVGSGKAISRAQARRQIKSGAVKVDGVQLRKDDATVKSEQVVTFRGEELQG